MLSGVVYSLKQPSEARVVIPFLQMRKLRLLAFIIQKVAIKLVLEATPMESQFLNTVCYICQKRFLHISLHMYTME